MKPYNKASLLFLKFIPVVLLYGCLIKICLLYFLEGELVKHINVVLNAILALGLYCISYTLNFCKVYRVILAMTLIAYILYDLYLAFDIPYNNIWSRLLLVFYSIGCFIYTFYYRKKCKLHRF